MDTHDPSAERNVSLYRSREFPLFEAEKRILDRHVRDGPKVLDLGCGSGRLTGALAERGACVWACDLDTAALVRLKEIVPSDRIEVLAADARSLPFPGGTFDIVLFSYNGLDFVIPESAREDAIREMSRVTVPGGVVIFSSHNPIGSMLSPRGLRARDSRRWRRRFIVRRAFLERFFENPDGLTLHHARPRAVIRQIEEATGLTLVEVRATRAGWRAPRWLLTLFSAWPYYVFRKPGGTGRHSEAHLGDRVQRSTEVVRSLDHTTG